LPERPLSFAILRVPFFLEPSYDESQPFIESNRERLVKKWGGVQGWEKQKKAHNLKGRGAEAGIPHFNLDRLAASSMASHRLIQHLGKTRGLHVSEAIYDLLNVYYFVDGHSLNDRPRLARVVSAKLQEMGYGDESAQENALLDFFNGQQGRAEIERATEMLKQLGVNGIPKFIIEGRTVIDGAERSETFIRVFRQIEQRGFVMGGPVFADILGVSRSVIQQGSHLL
jgi:predicted DsbA family dithiol-disulfide isomerase